MGFIDKIKNFFNVELEDVKEEVIEEPVEPEPKPIPTNKECEYCKEWIIEGQPVKSFDGKRYHKVCFKQLRKEAKKHLFR